MQQEKRLPLPLQIPAVNLKKSGLHVITEGGVRYAVPTSCIARCATETVVAKQSVVDELATGWPTVILNHIFVLSIRNTDGQRVYGWFVRFESDPRRLMRVPLDIVARTFLRMDSCAHLKTSRLYEEFCDVRLVDESVCFCALMTKHLQHVNNWWAKGTSNALKKRKREPVEFETALSVPPSPRRKEMNDTTTCSLCLEDLDDVQPSTCCGSASSTCFKCKSKLRGLCLLCDRSTLSSHYECSCCKQWICFEQSGFPCLSCEKASVCRGCHSQGSVCSECL